MNVIPCASHEWVRGQEETSSEDEYPYSTVVSTGFAAFQSYKADSTLHDTWSGAESSSVMHMPAPLPEISEFLREETKAIDTHYLQFNAENLTNENKSYLGTNESKHCCKNNKNLEDYRCYETLVSCTKRQEPEKVKLKRTVKDCDEPVYLTTVNNKRTKSGYGDLNSIEQKESFKASPEKHSIPGLESIRRFQTQENEQEHFEKGFENLERKSPNSQNLNGNTVDNFIQSPFFTSSVQNEIVPALSYCEQPRFPNDDQETVWSQNQSTVTSTSENSFSPDFFPNGNPAVSNNLLLGNFHDIKQEDIFNSYLNNKLPPGNSAVWNNFHSDAVNNHTVSYANQGEICNSPKFQHRQPLRRFQLIGQASPIDLKEITWQDAKQHTPQPDLGFLQLQTSNSLLDDIDLSDVDYSCMEHIEREYHKEAVKEMELACSLLKIPTDAEQWSEHHVDKWIMWTVHQCNLPVFDISLLRMSGLELCKLSAKDMLSRVPTCGDILHARLRIWRSAAKMRNILDSAETTYHTSKDSVKNEKMVGNTKFSSGLLAMGNEDINIPKEDAANSLMKTNQTSSIHLWVFLKELLMKPQLYGQFIRWIDQEKGVFKIEDSVEVARLWGVRKNRPAMNYDKLSRSIRQYYKKGIIKKTAVSQRLVYQFVNPALSV